MILHKVFVTIFTNFFMLLALSLSGQTNRQAWKDKRTRVKEKSNHSLPIFLPPFFVIQQSLFLLLVRTNRRHGTGLFNITEGKRSTAKQSLSIYRGNLDKTQQDVELVGFFSKVGFHCILIYYFKLPPIPSTFLLFSQILVKRRERFHWQKIVSLTNPCLLIATIHRLFCSLLLVTCWNFSLLLWNCV